MAAVHLVHLTCFRWRFRNSTPKSTVVAGCAWWRWWVSLWSLWRWWWGFPVKWCVVLVKQPMHVDKFDMIRHAFRNCGCYPVDTILKQSSTVHILDWTHDAWCNHLCRHLCSLLFRTLIYCRCSWDKTLSTDTWFAGRTRWKWPIWWSIALKIRMMENTIARWMCDLDLAGGGVWICWTWGCGLGGGER